MKFMHVADLHLDRAFEGVRGLGNEHLGQQLQGAKQRLVKRLVDVALDEGVDFLLVAGDTFHQSVVTATHQHIWQQQLARLAEAEIPVFWQFGNHDYYQAERYWFAFPANVHLFKTEEVTTLEWTTKQQERVAISSFSYQEPTISSAKASEFPARQRTCDYHIGMYHGQLGTNHGYAPFTVGELAALGYDYWALGHIHVPTVVSQTPLMVYPGTPEGHNRKETEVAGVVLVEMEPSGTVAYRWEPVATVGWQTVRQPISGQRSAAEESQHLQARLLAEQHKQNPGLLFIQLHLEVANEAGQEVVQHMVEGELFAWLQTEVYQESQQTVWLNRWDTVVAQEEKDVEKPFFSQGANTLFAEVAESYQQPEKMLRLFQRAERYPELGPTLPTNEAERAAIIRAAMQFVTEGSPTE